MGTRTLYPQGLHLVNTYSTVSGMAFSVGMYRSLSKACCICALTVYPVNIWCFCPLKSLWFQTNLVHGSKPRNSLESECF